jgi:hypothetical protein
MKLTKMQAEELARNILGIVGIQPDPKKPQDEWWGVDTTCGTDKEVMEQSIEYMKQSGIEVGE